MNKLQNKNNTTHMIKKGCEVKRVKLKARFPEVETAKTLRNVIVENVKFYQKGDRKLASWIKYDTMYFTLASNFIPMNNVVTLMRS